MTLSPDVVATVRRLYFAEHWKRGTIASQLGIHFDAVVRIIGPLGPKAGAPRPDARVLDPYLGFVDEILERYPRLVATRLYDMLKERGYEGSLRSLRRHVRVARPTLKGEAFLRLETLPGEQAQVDWAHVGYLTVAGGKRPLWAFVMVLAYSRAMWAELVVEMSASSLRRSLVRASHAFGGSPRQWLFDNAKTIVIERAGSLVRFHPELLDLAARMHVEPVLCTPRKPQQKGKVERAIRFLKERFFAARSFHSIAHGNAQLLEFFDTVANIRPHPRFPDRLVLDVFDEEKPRLLTLPKPLPNTDLVLSVHVDKCAFVKLDTNRYSVPAQFAGGTLTLVADDQSLKVLAGQDVVACHERSVARHQTFELQHHRESILEDKRAARDLKGRDRLRAEIPDIDTMLKRWVNAEKNIGNMVTFTCRQLNIYGSVVVREVIAEMIRGDVHDKGVMAILCEQRRRRTLGPTPMPIALAPHVVERDVVPHDLGRYDE